MRLPEDLKDYHPDERDSFQLIDPDTAVALLLVGIILGAMMGGWK
jgi:hypothetical protein